MSKAEVIYQLEGEIIAARRLLRKVRDEGSPVDHIRETIKMLTHEVRKLKGQTDDA